MSNTVRPDEQARLEARADRALAQKLHRTWPAFFARFGRFTGVQRESIPSILEGANTLVCSATASGKTEAACAPLVERYYQSDADWTVLYISPTRALVNDLHVRLDGPLSQLSLRLGRRTGDHKSPLADIPNVLITTPESFDSMLCRQKRRPSGHALAHTRAIVLDEIHLLHTNSRGEQLRWLLERLRRLRRFAGKEGWLAPGDDGELQVVALSATVADPERVAERYLGSDSRVLQIPGGREIETVEVESPTPAVEQSLPRYLRSTGRDEKVLVFANARKRVDQLAACMRAPLGELGYEVRGHHGSLARQERERTEADIKRLRRIVVFSTSTLEIGVDIGDIDLIVLDGPPESVSALLQRIGRGNRRTGLTRVMTCAGGPEEVLVQSAMIAAARRGDLGPDEYGPSHAVACQQIASYIFQGPTRARKRKTLLSLVETCADEVVHETIISHLVQTQMLHEQPGEGIRLSDDLLDQADIGAIHSNIESGAGVSVVDEGTGEHIAGGIAFHGGPGLQIAGQMLNVREWHDQTLAVRRTTNPDEAMGAWSYTQSNWLRGAGQPHAVRTHLGIASNELSVIRFDGDLLAFHWGGGRRKAVLELLQRTNGEVGKRNRVNEWFVKLKTGLSAKPGWMIAPSVSAVELDIEDHLTDLEWWLARPLVNKKLPYAARRDEVSQWLRLEHELQWLAEAQWTEVSDSATRFALSTIANKALSKR